MGDDNKFFRVLNRINAILFTLTVSLVLLIALVGGYHLFAGATESYREAAAPNRPDDETLEFGGTLSMIEDPYVVLEGTGEAMLVLHREASNPYRAFSSGGRGSPDDVNVLLVDLASGRSHWMFRGTKRCIEAHAMVRVKDPDTIPQGTPNPVTAVLLDVAQSDSNGDGTVDCRDDRSLYLYRPGNGDAELLLPAKSITAIHQTADDRVLVTYSKGAGDRIAVFATPDFRRVSDAPLPFPPKP